MLINRFADDVVVWAPAKVNLYLELLGKRPDGYHELETLMVAVRLFDTLVLKDDPSAMVRLRCTHPTLPTGDDNLAMRAARLLQSHTGCRRGASLRLIKRIPLAAGLAGGSTDAAATLAGLNRLWDLGLSNQELTALAAQLGSDVPFFFHTPAAWCTGRGEQVTSAPLGTTLDFVVVCPATGLGTAEVYRHAVVPAQPNSGDAIRRALTEKNIDTLGGLMFNRLQPSAERLCPAVATIHARLKELNPAGQLMSGSGSSLFALCRNRTEAVTIARELARELRRDPEPMKVFQLRSC